MILTPRELDCLRASRDGLTRKETAARLVLSENSIRNERARIMRKLGTRTWTQAVALAERRGWLRSRAIRTGTSERLAARG